MGIIPNVSGATLHDLRLHLMVRVGWGGDNTKRVRSSVALDGGVGWGGDNTKRVWRYDT